MILLMSPLVAADGDDDSPPPVAVAVLRDVRAQPGHWRQRERAVHLLLALPHSALLILHAAPFVRLGGAFAPW